MKDKKTLASQRKIVIIRGKITAGKSTISHELAKVLPGWIFIDIWKIKEMFEPLKLKGDRTPMGAISKKAMMLIIREVMRTMKINIIVQESTQKAIKQHLRKDLKKYGYELYSFFLTVNVEDAVKRDKAREKSTIGVNKRKLSNEQWQLTGALPRKEDFTINTSENNVNQVVNIILKKIKERAKKHPSINSIRKTI